jgi:osmotically-inducible protein OsmY
MELQAGFEPDKYGSAVSGSGSTDILAASWLESLLVSRAAALARQGRLSEAEDLLLPLVDPQATGTAALDLLAKIKAQQNQLGEARQLWEQALKQDPDNAHFINAVQRCQTVKASGKEWLQGKGKRLFVGIVLVLILATLAVNNVQTHKQFHAIHNELAVIKEYTESINASSTEEEDDTELLTKVSAALQDKAFADVKQMAISERQGTVLVRGTVPDLNFRYKLEQAIRSIPGVDIVDVSELTLSDIYEVKPGDSLYLISKFIYGTPQRWQEIAEKNGLSPPYLLYSGQILKIP